MLQVQEFQSDFDTIPQPTDWARARRGNRLDCETAVLLRRKLGPEFNASESWLDLASRLSSQGFALRFEADRLILVETLRGDKVCSCRFLGHPLAQLSARFGKLRARPPKGIARFGMPVL
ncbi:MAG: hypothetical protein MK098_02990 [Marinovum sp.]|nr:hypothetical protein [Marinovum sp.]